MGFPVDTGERMTWMTTILIDIILGFWLLLFGGLALLPFITGATAKRDRPSLPVEDRVISITPARPGPTPGPGRRAPHRPQDDREQRDRPAA